MLCDCCSYSYTYVPRSVLFFFKAHAQTFSRKGTRPLLWVGVALNNESGVVGGGVVLQYSYRVGVDPTQSGPCP